MDGVRSQEAALQREDRQDGRWVGQRGGAPHKPELVCVLCVSCDGALSPLTPVLGHFCQSLRRLTALSELAHVRTIVVVCVGVQLFLSTSV